MRSLASFIMAGRGQAILVAAVSAVLSLLMPPLTAVFSYVGGAALMLVTLRRGPAEGATVLIGAALGTGALAAFTIGYPVQVVVATLVLWLPAWLVAQVLRSTVSLASAVITATAIGIAAIVVVHLWFGTPEAFWKQLLEALAQPAIEQGALELEPAQLDSLLTEAARMMTGAVAAAVVLGLMLSLWLARWWQAALYNPGGFGQEFQALRLPAGMTWLALAALALANWGSGVMATIALQAGLVMLVPFLFVGLAVVHRVATVKGTNRIWLVVLYGLLLIMPQAAVVLAVLGMMDVWVRFRDRVERSSTGPDDE